MRRLWSGGRVTSRARTTRRRMRRLRSPAWGIPLLIAAGGPQMAKMGRRVGDGFICTSGKGAELYRDSCCRI